MVAVVAAGVTLQMSAAPELQLKEAEPGPQDGWLFRAIVELLIPVVVAAAPVDLTALALVDQALSSFVILGYKKPPVEL